MPTGRHRAAHRATRPSRLRSSKALRAAAVTAPALTVGVVGVGLTEAGNFTNAAATVRDKAAPERVSTSADLERTVSLSRSATRLTTTAVAKEGRQARQRLVRYSTDSLNLRTRPQQDSSVDSEMSPGTKVIATGLVRGAFAEVSWKGERRWVTASYLSADRPATPETMSLSDAPCPRDSSVEHGLKASTIRVYRAVCANFPQITSYGGLGSRPEHDTGNAIDIMTTDVALGTQIAEFIQAHAAELDIYDVIWRQHIWTPVRSSEGWRMMPNRGSDTANHMNHVHVGTNP